MSALGAEALRAEGLVKTYGSGHTALRALDDVSISTRRGEVAALLGPSGAGKSTLLQALGLLSLPEQGTISVGGRVVAVDGQAREDLAAIRRGGMGFVFQKANLIPFLTARENVLLALQINGRVGAPAAKRADDLLGYLELTERAAHYPAMLSGGEQQRVSIARALANEPAVVFADEPTAALDKKRGRDVIELLGEAAHDHGTSVFVVTHDHRTLDLFDTIYEMEDGRLRPQPPVS
ncbi:MAG: ABC transporter ATP-binding protein [Vicinamibacteria bacterium]|nr:ABC transporter ATP-binding protein [Vicinamibacteria bacterium]